MTRRLRGRSIRRQLCFNLHFTIAGRTAAPCGALLHWQREWIFAVKRQGQESSAEICLTGKRVSGVILSHLCHATYTRENSIAGILVDSVQLSRAFPFTV